LDIGFAVSGARGRIAFSAALASAFASGSLASGWYRREPKGRDCDSGGHHQPSGGNTCERSFHMETLHS